MGMLFPCIPTAFPPRNDPWTARPTRRRTPYHRAETNRALRLPPTPSETATHRAEARRRN